MRPVTTKAHLRTKWPSLSSQWAMGTVEDTVAKRKIILAEPFPTPIFKRQQLTKMLFLAICKLFILELCMCLTLHLAIYNDEGQRLWC